MVFKILASFIIVAGCAYVGNGMSKAYRDKVRFFNDLNLLCNLLSNNIVFRKTKLRDILFSEAITFGNDLNKLIINFCETFNFSDSETKNIIEKSGIVFLEKNEAELVVDFLNCLGKSDATTQIESINTYKEIFIQKANGAKQEFAKTGALYQKLGVFVGILITILVI